MLAFCNAMIIYWSIFRSIFDAVYVTVDEFKSVVADVLTGNVNVLLADFIAISLPSGSDIVPFELDVDVANNVAHDILAIVFTYTLIENVAFIHVFEAFTNRFNISPTDILHALINPLFIRVLAFVHVKADESTISDKIIDCGAVFISNHLDCDLS